MSSLFYAGRVFSSFAVSIHVSISTFLCTFLYFVRVYDIVSDFHLEMFTYVPVIVVHVSDLLVLYTSY